MLQTKEQGKNPQDQIKEEFRVSDRLDAKWEVKTVPTLLSGLKELIQSYCFEQRLAFLNTGDELALPPQTLPDLFKNWTENSTA